MIKVGDKIPEGKFLVFTGTEFQAPSFPELLKGKKVILFGLPGAYTPTCDMEHLPSFVAMHDKLKAKGVDAIICVSVNDPFVLKAWKEAAKAEGKVELLSDWDATFTKAMGLDFDGSGIGMGTRSLRYDAIIEDGVVKHLVVEQDPGACGITKADNILDHL